MVLRSERREYEGCIIEHTKVSVSADSPSLLLTVILQVYAFYYLITEKFPSC